MSQSFCGAPASAGASAHRRRTDLMPTITHSMALAGMGHHRSPSAASATRTPGRAVSMSRLDKSRLYASGGAGAMTATRRSAAGGSMTTLLHANNNNSDLNYHKRSKQQDRRSAPISGGARRKSLSMFHLNQKAAAAQHQLAHAPSPVRQARKSTNFTTPGGERARLHLVAEGEGGCCAGEI